MARFRFRVHTLRIETVTWTHGTSPLLVTCVMLVMYKMSNTSFFTVPIHMRSLFEGLMLSFPPTGL